MSKEKIWLSSPHMGTMEQEFVKQAFDSNWVAPLGPNVNGFELDIQQFNRVSHASALTSGTAALHLALVLLDVQPGDYVICQSFTFSASANPILYQGAIPVFIDSEGDTWNMDPIKLEEGIEACISGKYGKAQKPKAIIPVHLYGMPAKIESIREISQHHQVPIIEDAAESLGSKVGDKYTGTFGLFGVFSFNGNKIITTSGGGALVSENKDFIDKSRFLATQARDQAPHYQHSHVGYNYRLSNILAGIGRGQMQVLPDRITARRKNYNLYKDYFNTWNDKGFEIKFQEESSSSFSNRWLTCITLEPKQNKGLNREEIRLNLEQLNIETRPLWKPMHMQPVFKKYPFQKTSISENLFTKGLCLPSGSNLTDHDFDRIFSALDQEFRRYT